VNFATKGKTLIQIKDLITSAVVPETLLVEFDDWSKDRNGQADKIASFLGTREAMIRSSCIAEDTSETSNAGAFLSIADVAPDFVNESIDKVFASYGESGLSSASRDHQVIVQPFLKNVISSGVAFSHDPNTGSEYRIINYAKSSDTSAVTGGRDSSCFQYTSRYDGDFPLEIEGVDQLVDELLILFDHIPIDVEFALVAANNSSKNTALYLLQVRPLIFNPSQVTRDDHLEALDRIKNLLVHRMAEHPFLAGRTTVLGVMPDWNPAEILGVRPSSLALSLYRDLITDSTWAYQRNNYGYRNLRSFPLMLDLMGLPYIDVRCSFNSFVPADIDEELASKLVDFYINKLVNQPDLHDKIEFEIVFSCMALDTSSRLKELSAHGFNLTEIHRLEDSLIALTNNVIRPDSKLVATDARRIKILGSRREKLLTSGLSIIDKIYWLVEDVRRYGTLPFAGLARAGFIAVQLLNSFVKVGIFSEREKSTFLESLETIASNIASDKTNLTRQDFVVKYGHLRPGTYDIMSASYDEDPDLYFSWTQERENIKPASDNSKYTNSFRFTNCQLQEIEKCLSQSSLNLSSGELIEFIKTSIGLREQAKFEFTKNVSLVLKLVSELGEEMGFTKADMANCDIRALKELSVRAQDPRVAIRESICQGRKIAKLAHSVVLPPLLTDPSEVFGFQWPETTPNFITQKTVVADVIADTSSRDGLDGKLVFIKSADPGFDWLFDKNIGGLVTAYGGVNSHMAIRCGELGIPAVIGLGEVKFEKYKKVERLSIDCANRTIRCA